MKKEIKKQEFSALNETGEFRDTWRIFRIMSEFVDGYQFLSQFKKVVTIMGSARLPENSKYYNLAQEVGSVLAKHGITTVTGGGPGIMEAGNRGATEAGGESVGLNIQLPFEQRINPYVKQSTAFHYFFTRKVMLTAPAHAFVFFPGGYGTMDEFFEIVDMMDLGKMYRSPLILVGSEFWNPIINFLNESCKKLVCEHKEEIQRWRIVDSVEEVEKIVKDVEDINICELAPMNFVCDEKIDWKIFRIMAELVEGFEFLTGLVEDVTVLGSKSIKKDNRYYNVANNLGTKLAEEGFAVVTGGGIGAAEAVNKGVKEAGGDSIGIAMKLNDKAPLNEYVTRSMVTSFPFVRKLLVTAPSKGFVFFPGRLGTLHQLFEVLALVQTGKMAKLPIILYDTEFWGPLKEFIRKVLVEQFKTINSEDLDLFHIVDNEEEIVEIIKKSRKEK
ncbi:MAG: TIGR00730 family Rossman fold protein [Candidatus Magasanikbacteria bacterium]|nr:TIGR00730 family Rossman fold protein [Candidatus Magasanikbacteria bacterium]